MRLTPQIGRGRLYKCDFLRITHRAAREASARQRGRRAIWQGLSPPGEEAPDLSSHPSRDREDPACAPVGQLRRTSSMELVDQTMVLYLTVSKQIMVACPNN
jgi:hypothetical protein